MLALSGPAFITFGYLLKVNLILGSIFGGCILDSPLMAELVFLNHLLNALVGMTILNSVERGLVVPRLGGSEFLCRYAV
jgi:hypothetical protein